MNEDKSYKIRDLPAAPPAVLAEVWEPEDVAEWVESIAERMREEIAEMEEV